MILTALFFQNVIQKILSKRRFVVFSSIVVEPRFPLYLPLMLSCSVTKMPPISFERKRQRATLPKRACW